MNNLTEIIENMIGKQNVSFISSVDEDGYPNTKAMLAPVKQEGIKTFYWHTNSLSVRIKQYRINPKACIYFCDEHSFEGVMLKGTMEVVDDPDTKKDIWKDDFSIYYQGGVDGGDFILLRFTAETGRYYSNFNSDSFVVGKEDSTNDLICQSCGMNMKSTEDFGTNADGTRNEEYCHYCYQNGAFTRNVTMDEMLETNLKYLDHWNAETGNNFTPDEARPILREFLSSLKRWKSE